MISVLQTKSLEPPEHVEIPIGSEALSALEHTLHGEKITIRFNDKGPSNFVWGFDSNNVLTIARPIGPVDLDKYIAGFVREANRQYPKLRQFVGIVLHYHQPAGQESYWVDKATDEAYLPQSQWLARTDKFRGTVNITSSLLEHLERLRHYQVIDNFRTAAERGTIELTATGAKHPILPGLLKYDGGEARVRRQIRLNEEINKRYFGSLWNPRGFFPPELAFSSELAEILNYMGFEWAITDAPLYDAVYHRQPSIPHNRIGTVRGLNVFFRSDERSNELSIKMPEKKDYDIAGYIRRLKNDALNPWFNGKSGYVILSFDGETFGHQVPQYANGLETIARTASEVGTELQFTTLSKLQEKFGVKEVSIKPGSWSTSVDDIARGEYFPAWYHSQNHIHHVLDETMGLAIGLWRYAETNVNGNAEARRQFNKSIPLLDDGEQSDPAWWARKSDGKFDDRMIYNGFNMLSNSARHALNALEQSGYREPLRINGFRGTIPELRGVIDELKVKLDYLVGAAKRS